MERNTLPKRKNQSIEEYCKEHYAKGVKSIDRTIDRSKGLKRCGGCGKMLPNSLKYFHKNSQTKDGLHYNCKGCRNKAKRIYYEQKLKKLII